LARRSGTLRLDTPAESGDIVFVGARSWQRHAVGPRETVGDILLHAGVVSPLLFKRCWPSKGGGPPVRSCFARFKLDPEVLDKALASLLTQIIYEMFEWDEGSFSFVLAQDPPCGRGSPSPRRASCWRVA